MTSIEWQKGLQLLCKAIEEQFKSQKVEFDKRQREIAKHLEVKIKEGQEAQKGINYKSESVYEEFRKTYLDKSDMAKFLKVTKRRIDQMIQEGKLQPVYHFGRVFFKIDVINSESVSDSNNSSYPLN